MSAPSGESWYFVHFKLTSLWINVVVVVFALVMSVAPDFLLSLLFWSAGGYLETG